MQSLTVGRSITEVIDRLTGGAQEADFADGRISKTKDDFDNLESPYYDDPKTPSLPPKRNLEGAFVDFTAKNSDGASWHAVESKKGGQQEDECQMSIASGLNDLSLQERDDAFCDIHGIGADTNQPSEEKIEESLKEMRKQVSLLKTSRPKCAFVCAEAQNSTYVHDRQFWLHLLRSEKFNELSATERLMAFFECKLEFFGKEWLCKDIRYENLNDEDLKVLEHGCVQVLPQRDQGNRTTSYLNIAGAQRLAPESVGRVMFWLFADPQPGNRDTRLMSRPRMLAVAGRGPTRPTFDAKLAGVFGTICKSIPYPPSAVFLMVLPERKRVLNAVMLASQGLYQSSFDARKKVISGSPTEWSYQLMTYGFPTEFHPWTASGHAKTKGFLDTVVTNKRAQEKQIYAKQNHDSTVVPFNQDVLFGRGRAIMNHPGNVSLKAMIDSQSFIDKYSSSSGEDKTKIALDVIQAVHESSARFLHNERGVWMEVTGQRARVKVSETIRDRIRRNKRSNNQAQPTPYCTTVRKPTFSSLPPLHKVRKTAFQSYSALTTPVSELSRLLTSTSSIVSSYGGAEDGDADDWSVGSSGDDCSTNKASTVSFTSEELFSEAKRVREYYV